MTINSRGHNNNNDNNNNDNNDNNNDNNININKSSIVPETENGAIPGWICIILWMLLGASMIIFNKMVLSTWKFGFPFFLAAWHCLLTSILTKLLAMYTSYLPGVSENKVTSSIYWRKIIPISFCFAFGLVAGNSAYKYLSVAYIQMLKSFTPVTMLLVAFIIGREKPSMIQLALVLMISAGVALTSMGELEFSIIGFLCQFSAMFADVSRTTLMDIVLEDLQLDSLSMVYYLTPPSFVFISIGFFIMEYSRFSTASLTPMFTFIIFLNGLHAFLLNVAVVIVVKYTSPVIVSLSGILKDISLVISSSIIFQTPISVLQFVGYTISLIGLNIYREYRTDPTMVYSRISMFTASISNLFGMSQFMHVKKQLASISTDESEESLLNHRGKDIELEALVSKTEN